MSQGPSSRRRYREFVQAYHKGTLDDPSGAKKGEAATAATPEEPSAPPPEEKPAPRKSVFQRFASGDGDHLRAYLRWLRPHRRAIAVVFVLALVAAGLQMIEPLFMRFIIDRVLLNNALDAETRLTRLNLIGGSFLAAILLANLMNMAKDYRQRLLNVRVMLSLRRTLFDRLLHLPLPALWEMKTGGILSRLTGDVDTTTGLLQMAVFAPALSVHPAGDRDWHSDHDQLAAGADGNRRDTRRDAHELRVRAPHPSHLSHRASRRRADRRARGRDVRRHPRCPRVQPRAARAERLYARPARRPAQGALRSPPRACAVDLLGTPRRHRQRRNHLVRRPPLRAWPCVGGRHHGFPVVHVPAAQPGLEHRQLLFRVAAVAGGDGAGLRGARHAQGQARSTRRRRRTACRERDQVRRRELRVPARPAGGPRLRRDHSRWLGGRAGGAQRRRQDHRDRPGRALPRSDRGRDSSSTACDIRRLPAVELSRPARHRAAGRVPVRRLGARQHRLRPERRDGRRDRGRRPARQRRTSSSSACPSSTTRSSANGASSSPAGSSSGSPSPAPSWRRRRFSSSTKPPATSTPRASSSSRRRWPRSWPIARRS